MGKKSGQTKTVGPRRYNPLNKKTKAKKNRAAQFAANVQRLNFTHAKFVSGDQTFIACCAKAGIPPTKRQASAFRHGHGAAFAQLKNLKSENTTPAAVPHTEQVPTGPA